jgi:peptidoglycan-associated lipoprotein
MKQSVRPFHRTILVFAFAAALLSAGCAKKPKAQAPVAPPPPPAASKPTVTFSADPASITKGASATLTWSTTDATNVSISPEVGAVTAQGSTKVSPADSLTYTLTATGPGGSADASARVTVSQPPPAETKAPEPGIDELFLKEVRDAYFDLDKADIRADAREALGKTAEFLRNYPQVKVTIEGHCDERGSTEYNLALGDRRASAVKQYLVSLGISADRMNTVSYGKEKPVCTEANEDCYQKNRRGHFVRSN